MARITAVLCCNCMRTTIWLPFYIYIYTVVQVAGEGGMGEDEVVEVGVLLECWKISSSRCECPGGEVATRLWAVGSRDAKLNEGECVIALTTLNSTYKQYLILVVPTSQYSHWEYNILKPRRLFHSVFSRAVWRHVIFISRFLFYVAVFGHNRLSMGGILFLCETQFWVNYPFNFSSVSNLRISSRSRSS